MIGAKIIPLCFIAAALLSTVPEARAEPAAFLTVQAQGMAPNQPVTLSTGPAQQLSAQTTNAGAVSFNNLRYTPSTPLSFALSYSVKGGGKNIPNNFLISLDPYVGTVKIQGNATRAASIVVSVSAEDSQAMIANQKGYFSGSARSFSGFEDGNLRVVANIINVEEGCCPRSLKPYLPVTITLSAQPEDKKAELPLVAETETASLTADLPEISYGVSVPTALIKGSWVNGMYVFANRIIEYIEQQTTSLGTLMQGQTNVDAMRSLQQGQAATAKNYLPSEQLCRFGTLSQSLGSSQAITGANKQAIASALLSRELGSENTVAASGDTIEADAENFEQTNCDPTDSNLASSRNCENSKDPSRYNREVDYTRSIDAPLTIGINFDDGTSTPEEQDILKMGERLFPSRQQTMTPDKENYIQNSTAWKSLQALRSVAKNSFVALTAEKAEGTAGSALFIKNLMASLNIPKERADSLMGAKPSYYAQMEVLTKKLYQDPAFYVNLIDTPANIERQKAAIRAIKLQQQNDFAQVVKRREMLLAVLLELKLRERSKLVNQRIAPTRKPG